MRRRGLARRLRLSFGMLLLGDFRFKVLAARASAVNPMRQLCPRCHGGVATGLAVVAVMALVLGLAASARARSDPDGNRSAEMYLELPPESGDTRQKTAQQEPESEAQGYRGWLALGYTIPPALIGVGAAARASPLAVGALLLSPLSAAMVHWVHHRTWAGFRALLISLFGIPAGGLAGALVGSAVCDDDDGFLDCLGAVVGGAVIGGMAAYLAWAIVDVALFGEVRVARREASFFPVVRPIVRRSDASGAVMAGMGATVGAAWRW